jgi:hypothetical protein
MSSGSLQNPSTSPSAPIETTPWTGWVAFAAFIMMLSGTSSRQHVRPHRRTAHSGS